MSQPPSLKKRVAYDMLGCLIFVGGILLIVALIAAAAFGWYAVANVGLEIRLP